MVCRVRAVALVAVGCVVASMCSLVVMNGV
jgi:hypothetical protein